MSKKLKPFLAHSELTDCIYIIDGNDKYEVTEQCIKAMKATNRMANVLDKIRAEIDQYLFQNEFGLEYRKEVSQIIDKYKAKREGCDYHPSVVKNDITRLRRELNDVRRGMEWN